MEIVFVRTRYHYDSYIDFWKLVELSGFPTCYTDEVNIHKNVTYLVSPYNGEWRPIIDAKNTFRKARLFMLNLERPGGSGSLEKYISDNNEHIQLRYFDNIFVVDKELSRLSGFPYMMIGGHEGFGSIGNRFNKVYDIITLSCYSPARAWMFDNSQYKLHSHLGGMKMAPNAPIGDLRDILLKSSKAILNVHQDNFNFIEPLRFIIAIMYGLPIFTEECDISNYPSCHKFSKFSEYSHMIKDLLDNDYNRLYDEAIQARVLFTTEYTFRNMILRAINGKN